MFEFFKKYKKAEPIFEALVTDMHNHLVPMVDDGSRSMTESLQCIRTMQDLGYKRMYITPHFQFPRFPNNEEDIKRRFEEVKEAAKNEGLEIELIAAGGEYRIDDSFEKRIDDPHFLLINDRYVLVELSLHQPRMGMEEVIFNLQMKGFEVILAHPERYPYLNIHSKTAEHLREQGVLFQLNVLSLDGFYGEAAEHKAQEYLKAGWADMLGTDLHNTKYAGALIEASKSCKVRKILEKYQFLNTEL
ncbi:MAG: hypothetical protein MJZ81_04105 [Bacteroidales bacterium]|nr:hypothetical protein [Bacteroidales bacterium]